MNLEQAKALFINQYVGLGLKMKCIAKSFQLPDKELRGVLLNDNQERTLYLSENGKGDFYDINEWVLIAREITQLTDEEKQIFSEDFTKGSYPIESAIKAFNFYTDGKSWYMQDVLKITDYLRSIGILLPFTYLSDDNTPITLSPSQLIELNWVRIKE